MERCHEETRDNEEVVVLASSTDDLFNITSPALQTEHPAPFTMIKQREREGEKGGRDRQCGEGTERGEVLSWVRTSAQHSCYN